MTTNQTAMPALAQRATKTGQMLEALVHDPGEFERRCSDPHSRAGLRQILLGLGQLLQRDAERAQATPRIPPEIAA